jgi:hypothetical protein
MSVCARLLQVEDEEDTVIGVLISNTIAVEDLGGKLMWVTRQIVEEHHCDLKAMGLYIIRSCLQLRDETLFEA